MRVNIREGKRLRAFPYVWAFGVRILIFLGAVPSVASTQLFPVVGQGVGQHKKLFLTPGG